MKLPLALEKTIKNMAHHSPEILSVLSIAGIVGTAILASKAGKEVSYRIQDSNKDYDKITIKEKIQLCWKNYVPTVLVGTATIACVVSSNLLNRKQQASLMGAYALLNEGYKKYRLAAKEVYGEDADTKIKAQVAKDAYITSDGLFFSDLLDPENIKEDKCLFYDSATQTYFQSTLSKVLNAEYHVNRNFVLRGYVPLSEYCDFLGIDISEKDIDGDKMGWSVDDNFYFGEWIDFVNSFTTLEDGLECYVIDPCVDPFPISEY